MDDDLASDQDLLSTCVSWWHRQPSTDGDFDVLTDLAVSKDGGACAAEVSMAALSKPIEFCNVQP